MPRPLKDLLPNPGGRPTTFIAEGLRCYYYPSEFEWGQIEKRRAARKAERDKLEATREQVHRDARIVELEAKLRHIQSRRQQRDAATATASPWRVTEVVKRPDGTEWFTRIAPTPGKS
jgi:hypothetical protein